ncbi:MAG TPA: TolC family protein, partial [Longimicrobiales bacterium]
LSLADALNLARGQSPDYLVTQNDEADAVWAVRQAYGALVPTAGVGMGFQYQAGGTPQVVGGLNSSDFGISSTPPYYTSSWGLNFGYSVSGAILYAPSLLKARRRAATANTDAAGAQLDAAVTQQYLAVLQAQDALKLATEQLASATENLRLTQAKVNVGSAIGLEAKQAEVERGHAQVAVLKAQNDVAAQKLQLGQRIGTELPADVTLTTTFDVFTPPWSQNELIQRAMQRQPALRATAAQEDAARAQIKSARTAYMPSLDFAVGFSGYARENGDRNLLLQQALAGSQSQIQQCELYNTIAAGLTKPLPPQDCSTLVLTPAAQQKLIDNNNAFPFRYTSQPWYASMRVSLPIFSGLNRERNLESAKLAARTAELRTRQQELATRTAVSTAYATLVTAQKAFEIEKANREAAAEQLTLEQERYRVGSSSFIQLQDAQTRKAVADNTYIVALYTFQNALATLESAVGEKLITPKTGN